MLAEPVVARNLAHKLRDGELDRETREAAARTLESMADLYVRMFRMLERLRSR
jgi:hypothetical protein